MPDDKLKAADDEDEKVDAALEDVVEDDDEDEDDDKEESSASASIEAAVNAAVEAAMSKRRPARRAPKRQELNAADIGAAVAASITPLFSKFENALADAKKESARQAAIAHATELAASLPPGLRDGAVEQLAAIDDKKQRTAMGEILASAAGVLAPVNLEDLKVEAGAKIDSIYIEAAAADLGIGIDDIRGPIRDSVMKLAASKASSAKATEVH